MNHLNVKNYSLYDYSQTVNSYGVKELNSTALRVIRANVIDKEVYSSTDNIRSLVSDCFALTDDKNCRPNQVLVAGDGSKYAIVSAINSGRFAQLSLKRI